MDIVKLAIKCQECSSFLVKPVMLPCGSSVCHKHLTDLQNRTFLCKSCGNDHQVDEGNLAVNKSLEMLINANLDKLDFGAEYSAALEKFNQLDQTMFNLETLRKHPTLFIRELIGRLKNMADLIREELKLTIDQNANQIIEQLNNYENECINNLESADFKTKLADIDQKMMIVKENMERWQTTLNDFASNQHEWKLVNSRCCEDTLEFKKETYHFKKDLLMNKINDHFDCITDFQDIEITINKKFYEEMEEYQDILRNPEISTSKILNDKTYEEMLDLCDIPFDSKLKLIYRGSEHGFTAKDFHNKCDNVQNTLTVIKSTCGSIFGGYTSQAWDQSGTYKTDSGAYVFSLVNSQDQKDKICINNPPKAIYCRADYGPTFGSDDLLISFSNNFSRLGTTYHRRYYWDDDEGEDFFVENLAISRNFSIKDIEIYQII